MKISAFMIASLLLAAPAIAKADDDHEHEGEVPGAFNVEAYALTLQGTQPFGEACYIGVVEQGLDISGNYFAEVETSLSHGEEGPGRLRIIRDATRPGFLAGVSASGSQMTVRLKENGATLADALRYAVRWTHEGHVDSGLCEGLSVVHDAEAEEAEAVL